MVKYGIKRYGIKRYGKIFFGTFVFLLLGITYDAQKPFFSFCDFAPHTSKSIGFPTVQCAMLCNIIRCLPFRLALDHELLITSDFSTSNLGSERRMHTHSEPG